jgi:hypothetical protein
MNNPAYLCTDAWLVAGENPAGWIEQRDPRFRFGIGAVRRVAGGRAWWNLVGVGFTLWSQFAKLSRDILLAHPEYFTPREME